MWNGRIIGFKYLDTSRPYSCVTSNTLAVKIASLLHALKSQLNVRFFKSICRLADIKTQMTGQKSTYSISPVWLLHLMPLKPMNITPRALLQQDICPVWLRPLKVTPHVLLQQDICPVWLRPMNTIPFTATRHLCDWRRTEPVTKWPENVLNVTSSNILHLS